MSLPLDDASLRPDASTLTQLNRLSIMNVGTGYRHLPASLKQLAMEMVDIVPEQPDAAGQGKDPRPAPPAAWI